MPYIGNILITDISNDDIQSYIHDEQKKERKASTINRSIRTVTNVLNKCSRLYRDQYKQSYLQAVPLLKQLPENDKKTTVPLSYSQESALLSFMSEDYKDLWLFASNTGLRDDAQASLTWDWEFYAPKLDTYVFIIPAEIMKDTSGKAAKKPFYLIINQTSKTIIDKQRGKHQKYVFPSPSPMSKTGKRNRFNNTAFKNAREKAGLKGIVDWHSARATFSTRLRANGVSEEDRATLMHHADESITTQYSHARINYLYQLVCLLDNRKQEDDVLLKVVNSSKIPSSKK